MLEIESNRVVAMLRFLSIDRAQGDLRFLLYSQYRSDRSGDVVVQSVVEIVLRAILLTAPGLNHGCARHLLRISFKLFYAADCTSKPMPEVR